jgi:hypothetical protein
VTRRENIIAVGNSGTGKSTSVSGSVSRPARKEYRRLQCTQSFAQGFCAQHSMIYVLIGDQ